MLTPGNAPPGFPVASQTAAIALAPGGSSPALAECSAGNLTCLLPTPDNRSGPPPCTPSAAGTGCTLPTVRLGRRRAAARRCGNSPPGFAPGLEQSLPGCHGRLTRWPGHTTLAPTGHLESR